jgi:hypothetical protein
MGYWWVELGGLDHAIHDTEKVRDELLATLYGVWDHVKNSGQHGESANWALDWVQFLPAKRESRRYVGRQVLTQNDITAGGEFPDIVAYGGWRMDDHPPMGFACGRAGIKPAQFNPAPSPYGIPYGTLVGRDLENLMFAGRCASCTHTAMSSTRVMGTGAVMGQAAGTAAAMAVRDGVAPARISAKIDQLQQALLADDAYLPRVPQRLSPLTMGATLKASTGDPAPLRDGVNRPVGDDQHAWHCRPGDWLEIHLAALARVERLTLIADSALHRIVQMSHWQKDDQLTAPPESLLKDVRVEVLADGEWRPAAEVRGNYQRLVRIAIGRHCAAVRLTLESTWAGADQPTRLFAVNVDGGDVR